RRREERALLFHVRATLLLDEDHRGRPQVCSRAGDRRRGSSQARHGRKVEGVRRERRGGLLEGVIGHDRAASSSVISPSLPSDGGEAWGEEARSYWPPSPWSSLHSFLAGRGW